MLIFSIVIFQDYSVRFGLQGVTRCCEDFIVFYLSPHSMPPRCGGNNRNCCMLMLNCCVGLGPPAVGA